MGNRDGKIIIGPGLNVWPHELKTAEALARAGHAVEFVRKSEVDHQKTPDVLINGVQWELKSPTADNLKAVERNLKRARWQSENIVFDCRRMKKVPDIAIQRRVSKCANEIPGVRQVLYVDKRGNVIDLRRSERLS